MYTKEALIFALLIVIIVPIFFSIIVFFKTRGEKKIQSKDVVRTRPPKMISVFFLGFALIAFLGGTSAIIYCCIELSITALEAILMALCIAVFSSLGFFTYAYARFNYVVADNEGILVSRLFRKKRYYRYEEIGYFKDTTKNMGIMGDLIGYSKDNVKIFTIDALSIGASTVAQRLREHGVKEERQIKLH